MTTEQTVVQDDIQTIRGQIRLHGNPCIATASLGGIHAVLNGIKYHTCHDNAIVGGCHIMRVFRGPAKTHDGTCKVNKKQADNDTHNKGKQYGGKSNIVG